MASILDMLAVSDSPAGEPSRHGLIWPLSADQLLQLFGTPQPTRALVEGAGGRLSGLRERWQGLYIVVYDQGLPSEICFAGVSGD